MIPYSNFLYFYLMALALLPAVVIGCLGKRIKWYGVFACIGMLCLIFYRSRQEAGFFVKFLIFEFLLILIYDAVYKKHKHIFGLWIMILGSLAPLLYSKLSNIFVHRPLGFIGISYLTFKIVQTLIQIYDGYASEMNVFDLVYFVLFFPTFSSGPIDRSLRFIEECNREISRREYLEYLGDGIFKIVHGIFYKFIVAYLIQKYFMGKIPAGSHDFLVNMEYMYTYSFYLFFDFAGYSLIAIGVSYILGIKTPENFNLPFISRDIKDFWNRWHMTLSFWFRDYVYNRFVMCALKNKWFKSKYTASYLAFLITMTTMGLWHGFQLNYIAYGLYHGLLLIGTDYFERKPTYKRIKNNQYFKAASVFITFNIVCFGFYLFSGYLFK